jgi:XRE family transcriptional regulator, regulator of sulfur utilization
MKIGAILREARDAKGLTQVQVCKKAKISQTFLSQLESDAKNASPVMLKKLCRVYGIPPQIIVYKSIEEKDVRPEMREVFNKLNPAILNLVNEFFNK